MKTMKASEFKAKCLGIMDEVQETREEVVITKNGRPMAKLVPFTAKPKTLRGLLKDEIKILGDIVEPVDGEWEAMK